jgi:hypothetical protein
MEVRRRAASRRTGEEEDNRRVGGRTRTKEVRRTAG